MRLLDALIPFLSPAVMAWLLASCSASGGEATDRAAHQSSELPDTFRVSPVLSIGDPELGLIVNAFVRRDRIYVANSALSEIREYDLSGNLVRRIGRRGAGPGEFLFLRWIAPLEPDSLVALDREAWRVTVFGPDGRYARSFSLRLVEYGQPEWIAAYGHSFALGFSKGLDPRRMGSLFRDSVFIALTPVQGPEQEQGGAQLLPSVPGRWWARLSSQSVRAVVEGAQPLFSSRDSILMIAPSDSH
ncbi:MAG: hypothetical protein KatS3mg081_0319 [Gemmatimonadales bacterium]|nr:MAG: hypothetical protein KatS3mg081_0319 [Gemmatimonadales bacterium]